MLEADKSMSVMRAKILELAFRNEVGLVKKGMTKGSGRRTVKLRAEWM